MELSTLYEISVQGILRLALSELSEEREKEIIREAVALFAAGVAVGRKTRHVNALNTSMKEVKERIAPDVWITEKGPVTEFK